MKSFIGIVFTVLPLCAMAAERASAPASLAESFHTPPHEAKPWVYWWFQGGYGDPQGMARDLEEMKAKGIGGVMHMQTLNAGGLPLPKPVKMLSPEWDSWFGEALRLARQNGITMSASILDGWSHGGGWVGKEDGAKQLVHAETQVDGPTRITDPLPMPSTRLGVYHEVAVVAFREKPTHPPVPLQVRGSDVVGGYCGQEYWPAAHAVDNDPESFVKMNRPASQQKPLWLELTYAQPITVTGAFIAGMPNAGPAACEIQFSEDGKTFKSLNQVAMTPGEQKQVSFAPATARIFRLLITQAHAPDLELAEFQLLRPGDQALLRPGIKNWDLKSANVGGGWGGWPKDLYAAMEEEYTGAEASDVAATEVVDLSAHLQADGRLDWSFPEGRWTVMRFGWTPIGEPARMGNGGGYEVDVLNTKGADLMMDQPAQRMRDLSVKNAGGAPIIFHTDSWEIGAGKHGQQPTWTDDFREQFKKRRGYDLLPYLPAMARRLVDSRATTGRFLSDFRTTVADLLTAYYGRLQERAHEMNGGINSESGYGSFPHPHMDGLEVFGRADRPMAEFWHPYPGFESAYLQQIDVMRTAASGARIYGRRFVQAETLTFNPVAGLFTPPMDYRKTLHAAWVRGLNQAVIHKYTHQPMEQKPGLLDYDIFNRHFSWWPLADGLIGYMGRAQFLLQQGDFVADAAYFVGEGASRFVPGKSSLNPALPASYDFDGINGEVLKTRAAVKEGRLALPAVAAAPGVEQGPGLSYRYLVLSEPQCTTMTVATLARIHELVRDGLTLVGNRPLRTPGLGDLATMEGKLKEHADALWGADGQGSGERTVGKGRVIWGRSIAEIFARDGVLPDVEYRGLGETSKSGLALSSARWIWHAADGGWPPACTRAFKRGVEIPVGAKIRSARVTVSADNAFQLSVNGEMVSSSNDWDSPETSDITSQLQKGSNEILVRATNTAPGAAGLIFRLMVEFEDGKKQEIVSDPSWTSSADGTTWNPVAVVGGYGCTPWANFKPVALTLDFLHRTLQGCDIYFLANQSNKAVDMEVTLRATGPVVELFDPLDGSSRELPEKTVGADGRLTVPLRFEKDQAFFLVLHSGEKKRSSGHNIPALSALATIPGPWKIGFDAAWVKPLPAGTAAGSKDLLLKFEHLEDWTQRPEEGIKHYSGVATYHTSFPLPKRADAKAPLFLELGTVKEMARVTLNGRELGVAWCPPWRVRIPASLLKPAENALEITVANQWNNRLAADAALPPNERLTRVRDGIQEHAAKVGLQPAGLLGPVRLLSGE